MEIQCPSNATSVLISALSLLGLALRHVCLSIPTGILFTEATAHNEGDAGARIDWLLRERLSDGNCPIGEFKVWLCLCKENTKMKKHPTVPHSSGSSYKCNKESVDKKWSRK